MDCRLLRNSQGFFNSSILLLRNYHCFVTARFHFGQIRCARHTLHVASKLEGNRRPKQAKNAHVVHNCIETEGVFFYLPSEVRFCSVGRVSSAIRSPCYVSFQTRVCFLASSFSLSSFMCLVFYSHSSRHASAQLQNRTSDGK